EESELDRIVLDLPEPWHVVPHASEGLLPGGIFVSFSPTVLQVHELANALRAAQTFEMIETMEVLQRPWAVGTRSVRPEHRMVAHTGFITIARRCSPRPVSSVAERN
ncbi:MAG: tRNA (adenine-N1)-methyltransferase, partial [Chloroflexi bacterium]|nr:tRNA (adenine-N1)-methyltransferase [Chloroflexota bacterium]